VVQKILNRSALQDALIKAGLNQSGLAEKLKVSREAVSKWLAGESFPQPDKLLRMGMLLGLAFEQLVTLPPAAAVPLVSFRKKSHRKTKDEHLDNARETGELLKRLVKYLPKQELTRPPTLKEPTSDYTYVQAVAAQFVLQVLYLIGGPGFQGGEFFAGGLARTFRPGQAEEQQPQAQHFRHGCGHSSQGIPARRELGQHETGASDQEQENVFDFFLPGPGEPQEQGAAGGIKPQELRRPQPKRPAQRPRYSGGAGDLGKSVWPYHVYRILQ